MSEAVVAEPKRRTPPPRFLVERFISIKPDSTAQYLVKGLLQRTGLVVVWGAPKCGKSFWTFDLLMHAALGWEYRGRRVQKGTIVYCALEGAQGFRNRIEAFRQDKLSEVDGSDPPFYLMATPLSLVRDRKAFIADIGKQLDGDHPVAVCIDTLNRSLEGSESSDEDMAAYILAADAVRDAFGCLVVIVHHCGHGGARPRGHSSLMGAADMQIAVKRDAADNIVAELELSKDGEVGLQLVSRLKVVDIGVDQDGDSITSCVVEAVDSGAVLSRAAKPPPKSCQTALRALHKAIEEAGKDAPTSSTIPSSARVVSVETWRQYAYASGISDTDTPDARQKAFARAHKTLLDGNYVRAWNEHRWVAS
jgi:AAA domain